VNVAQLLSDTYGWWSGVAVARWSRSAKLTYAGPG